MKALLFLALGFVLFGCGGAVIEPGHRGILFEPRTGGVKHLVLDPGYYRLTEYGRVDDFDVTYSTKHEVVHTVSSEGLAMDVTLAIIFRPIVTELYELDTEIGQTYYDEVMGPEFRSASRGVFARHSYQELAGKNEKIEDEIEADLRRRTHGKHVEVSSITIEAIAYAPEITNAVRARLTTEQEALRQKAQLEADALKKKLEIENAAMQAKMTGENEAMQAKMTGEARLREKENERKMVEQDAAIEKIKAVSESENQVVRARAEAEQVALLAKAHAKEGQGISPLQVQMHAYDALAALGGSGATVLLGDWSHVPAFLFQHAIAGSSAVAPHGGGASPSAPAR